MLLPHEAGQDSTIPIALLIGITLLPISLPNC